MSQRTLILLITLTAASFALRLPLGAQCLEWKDSFALHAGLNDRGYALAVFDDGTGPALYAGGYFTPAGGVNATHVAQWNGSTWSPLGRGAAGGVGGVFPLAGVHGRTGPAHCAGG